MKNATCLWENGLINVSFSCIIAFTFFTIYSLCDTAVTIYSLIDTAVTIIGTHNWTVQWPWGFKFIVDSRWNVMAQCDAWQGKWRGNWQMEWVASTLHTTLEHGVSSITTADAQTSAVSSWLKWRPRRFKWTRPFHRKTKSGFCTCAITFQLASTLKCTDDHTMNWAHQWSVKNASSLWQVYFFLG